MSRARLQMSKVGFAFEWGSGVEFHEIEIMIMRSKLWSWDRNSTFSWDQICSIIT